MTFRPRFYLWGFNVILDSMFQTCHNNKKTKNNWLYRYKNESYKFETYVGATYGEVTLHG